MADEQPASVVKVLDELYAIGTLGVGELPLTREVITANLCVVVEELIENCTDPDLINRADDLLSAFRWVGEACNERGV